MVDFMRVGRWTTFAAGVLLIMPPQFVSAAELAPARNRVAAAATVLPIADVTLDAEGGLTGQALNLQGQPLDGATVVLEDGGQKWTAVANAQGEFRFTGVRGGAYRIRTGHQMKLCRVWKAGTAPPAANRGVLIVDGEQAIRGQYCTSPVDCGSPVAAGWGGMKEVLKNPLVIGGVAAAAIAIPVALHNSDDDDPAS